MLKNSNFIFLWLSQIFSQITINILNFLFLGKLFNITGSSTATSLFWLSYSLPVILLGPIGSAIVDIINRRKALIATNLLQFLIIIIYYIYIRFIASQDSISPLFILVIFYSAINQFYLPAESSLLPALVNKTSLPKANSLFFFSQQVSLFFGFGLGSLMVAFLGFENSILLSAIFLFLAFLSVRLITKLKKRKSVFENLNKFVVDIRQKIFEGYVFLASRKDIYGSVAVIFLIQSCLYIIIANMPSIAVNLIGVTVDKMGVYVVVPAALGALFAGISVSKVLLILIRKIRVIKLGFFAILISSSFLLLLTFLADVNKIFYLLFIFLIGLGYVYVNIPTITFLQSKTPDEIRGRVFGSLYFLSTVISIIPVIVSGILVDIYGIKVVLTAILLVAIIALLVLQKRK